MSAREQMGARGTAGAVAVRRAWAPGRVNLIGEHTDTTGGLCLPLAIQLGTEVRFRPEAGSDTLAFSSDAESEEAVVPLAILDDPAAVRRLAPGWARYVAAVAGKVRAGGVAVPGGRGEVRSDVPPGAGLSSSAALELAVALALGFDGPPLALAQVCRDAEETAVGVPCGLMDQLASAAGVEGAAVLLDLGALRITPVPLPEGLEIVVAHSGERRSLAGSAYAERRQQVESAQAVLGPLPEARLDDLSLVTDPLVRRRARHVITENARVRAAVAALGEQDLVTFGRCLSESHRSLAEDFEVSTPGLDALVSRFQALPGCVGARLTGAGFGGCIVAVGDPGLLARARAGGPLPGPAWVVTPGGPAHLLPDTTAGAD